MGILRIGWLVLRKVTFKVKVICGFILFGYTSEKMLGRFYCYL